jgi:hypothetical protein
MAPAKHGRAVNGLGARELNGLIAGQALEYASSLSDPVVGILAWPVHKEHALGIGRVIPK